MAQSSVIGALRVVLGADTASLETGLTKASIKLGFFAGAAAEVGKQLINGIERGFRSVATAIPATIDQFDKIGKSAQKIGIPVEELSSLAHAADLSGISFEQLEKGVVKLSKTMVEAAAKPTSEAALAFKALGVEVQDSSGKLKPTSTLLSDIAEAFGNAKDGAAKTAIAVAIFGRAGADLIPLLNSGKTGLQEMKDEALKLGIVIDTKTAKSAEAFNDNLTRLGKVKDAIIIKITAGMLPGLEKLSAAFVDVAKNADIAKNIGSGFGSILEGLALEVEKTRLSMETSAKERAAFVKAINTPLFTSEGKQAWLDYFATLEESKRRMVDLVAGVATFASRFDAASGSLKTLSQAQKELNYQTLGSQNAFKNFIDSQTKSIAAQEAEIATTGKAAGAKEKLKVQLEGLAVATAAGIPLSAALHAELDKTATSAGNTALRLEGVHLVQANLDPIKAYQQEMMNTKIAMDAVGATSEQIARAQDKVKDKFGESADAIGLAYASIAGSASSLLSTLGKDNKAFGIASKAFGVAQVVINTAIAASKALATLGPIGGPIAAAVMYAAGAASIAQIVSQKFAHGGSFRVGGGGGTDSQLVQFMATPGEMVDVRTPGTHGSSGTNVVNLTLQGDSVSRDRIREVFDLINSGIRDGYRIKMA